MAWSLSLAQKALDPALQRTVSAKNSTLKRKSEFEPSEDRKAIDEALMDFMKKQENVKAKPKKKEADDFEDLLAESGLTMEDLGF